MKVGDLVVWSQGHCHMPGLVLETRKAKALDFQNAAHEPDGIAILAMLPELSGPEWFHERELEMINESR